MTLRIPKSQLGGRDFDAEVQAFREATIESWKQPGPAPTCGPFVEEAIRRERDPDGGPDNLILDYEIVDDTPPPPTPPTAAELKAMEIQKSRQQEQAELDALMPAGKLRLFQMQFQDAVDVPEEKRTSAHVAAIAAMEALQASMRAIQRRGAEREAAIEDKA